MEKTEIKNLLELLENTGYASTYTIRFNNGQIPVEQYNREELKQIPVGKYYFIYKPSDADNGRDPFFSLAIWTDDDPDWVLAQWNEYKDFLSECYYGWATEYYEDPEDGERIYKHEYDEELSESLVDLTNWALETDYILSYATNLPQF